MTEKIKIVYTNYATADATTITASTEDSFYPADNIKDDRTTKKWRSTTTSDNVVFDLGSAIEIDTIIIRGDALDGREFTGSLTLQANSSDSWGAPPVSETITFSDEHNVGYIVLAAAETYQFWRIVGTGSSYVGLSNVCIGKAFIPARNMTPNFDYEERDLSTFRTNQYGQRFQVIRNRRDFVSLRFNVLTKTQVDEFMDMFDVTGETEPIWIIPDNAEVFSPEKERFTSQFYLRTVPVYNHFSTGLYNLALRLEEVI
jgi:hypothetical protein